jgi:predicted RNase H-like HicB family nuclease
MKSKGKKKVKATVAQGSYHYTVYFEPQSDGSFAVVFPTFPEIVTFGRTLDEARAMASDALRCHLGRIEQAKWRADPAKGTKGATRHSGNCESTPRRSLGSPRSST